MCSVINGVSYKRGNSVLKKTGRVLAALLFIALLGLVLAAAQLYFSGIDGQLWLEQSVWQKPVSKTLCWLNDSIVSWMKAPQLARQNISLMEENRTLRGQAEISQALERENRELREALQLKKRFPAKSIAAEVIVRDPQAWYAQIVVDKGSSEGVTSSMVAVASGNLVGKVAEVGKHSSLIKLITSERSVVPVCLAKNGATGIVYGENDRACRGRYFHRDVKTAPRDLIVTSGLGEIYPAGIIVGRIGPQTAIKENLFQEMTVVPEVDWASLQRVVLLQK